MAGPVMRKNMKLPKVMTALLLLMLTSCTNYDYIQSFAISGRVINQTTRQSIRDAKVNFVDTGFDYVRSKEHFAKNVGMTNGEGRLETKFDYFWGNQGILWIKPSSKKTFDITVERNGYRKRTLSFKAKN
jgi:hypothetical protein